jgi:CRP-like cAMP-binding protein
MDAHQLFLAFLNKVIPLEEEEYIRVIQPHTQVRQFKKKTVITKAGEVERYLNFLVEGLVRKYFKKDDDELITQISREGQIIHSQGSFHKQRPSYYFVETIEATTMLSIDFDQLNDIFSTSAKMERMGRLVITDIMVLHDRWQMMLLKMSPRERFLDFVQRNQELMQRTPQKFLASLLNIQPETFSRFKHLIQNLPPGGDGTDRQTLAEQNNRE